MLSACPRAVSPSSLVTFLQTPIVPDLQPSALARRHSIAGSPEVDAAAVSLFAAAVAGGGGGCNSGDRRRVVAHRRESDVEDNATLAAVPQPPESLQHLAKEHGVVLPGLLLGCPISTIETGVTGSSARYAAPSFEGVEVLVGRVAASPPLKRLHMQLPEQEIHSPANAGNGSDTAVEKGNGGGIRMCMGGAGGVDESLEGVGSSEVSPPVDAAEAQAQAAVGRGSRKASGKQRDEGAGESVVRGQGSAVVAEALPPSEDIGDGSGAMDGGEGVGTCGTSTGGSGTRKGKSKHIKGKGHP